MQLYLTVELVSRCSQVMGHVCALPYLNLTAAVVGTVITEVTGINHRALGRGGGIESKERERERLL